MMRFVGVMGDLKTGDQWGPIIPNQTCIPWWTMISDTQGQAIGSDEVREFTPSTRGLMDKAEDQIMIWRES